MYFRKQIQNHNLCKIICQTLYNIITFEGNPISFYYSVCKHKRIFSLYLSLSLSDHTSFFIFQKILTCPIIRFPSRKCGSFLPKLSLNVYFVRNQHHLLWIKRVFLQTFKMIFLLDSYLLVVSYVASVWFMVS